MRKENDFYKFSVNPDNSFLNHFTRRNFLKKILLGCFSALFPNIFIYGCTSSGKNILTFNETREDLVKQHWDCNPILPIPSDGCYTGTNKSLRSENLAVFFTEKYGLIPTFHAFGQFFFSAYNEYFPRYLCEKSIENGIIPVIRYVIDPFNGYKEISAGKYDKMIAEFASHAANFRKPLIFLPFQQPNQPKRSYSWGSSSSKEYVKAWIRMHNLFEDNGANYNTVWSTKITLGQWRYFKYKDPFSYIPPSEYVDIIGWVTNNLNKPERHLDYQSFKSLFNFAYNKARILYPNKPQMLWELSSAHGRDQAEWINDALSQIKYKYLAVKGVSFDQMTYRNDGDFDVFGFYFPDHTKETTEVVRKHFSDSYFIGSVI